MYYNTMAFEWKMLADTLKDILTDCYFVFNQDRITMNNVDPEKVVEIYYCMYPNLYPHIYLCEKTFTFPVYIQTIYRVLRGVKSTDVMEMNDLEDGSLHIKISTITGVLKNEISLRPLQQDMPTFIRNPRMYDASFTINNDQFYHILHNLSALSRQVCFNIKDSKIYISAQDESGTTSSFVQPFTTPLEYKNTYLVKFLEKFTKPGIAKFVDIKFSNLLPLNVVYHLENGYLELTIAGLE